MAVKIDVKLDAKSVTKQIAEIKTQLEALDEDGDIDLGNFDLDGIGDSVDNIVNSVEELSDSLDSVQNKLDGLEVDDIQMRVMKPDGGTGAGDSTGSDPPRRGTTTPSDVRKMFSGMNINELRSRASDRDLIGGKKTFDSAELREILTADRMKQIRSSGFMSDFVDNVSGGISPANVDLNEDDRNRMGMPTRMGNNLKRVIESAEIEPADVSPATKFGREKIGKQTRIGMEQKRFGKGGVSPAKIRGSSLTDFELDKLGMKKPGNDIGGGFPFKVKGQFGKQIKRFIPNMSQIYNLIAATIPIAVVLGAQLLGVAAAMGAVAAAGASIIGLGLLGHGDSMAESFANAKQQVAGLGEELFNVFQPTMQQFAPIQAEAFDRVPDSLNGIAESMEGLTAYEGTLFQLGGMLADGLETSVDAIVENEDAVSQLALRFSALAGSAIFDFFSFLFTEAKRNQDMLVSLGNSLKDLAVIAFRLLRVFVRFLDSFSPFIDILLIFSRILNTTVGQALFGFIAGMYLTLSVLAKLGLVANTVFTTMAGSSAVFSLLQARLGMLQFHLMGLIQKYTAASVAAAQFWSAATLGAAGLLAIGGGVLAGAKMMEQNKNDFNQFGGGGAGPGGSGSSGPGMSGGGTYNDNRSFTYNDNGNGDYANQQKFHDKFMRSKGIDESQEPPST